MHHDERSEARFATLVRQALEHFDRGDFVAAAQEFEAAIELAPDGIDVGTLEFNAAASEYQLEHFAQAEARFARLAARVPSLAALATLDAGMAALRDGRLDDAKRYLAEAPAGGDEAHARQNELAGSIANAERAEREGAFEAALKDGVDAYLSGDSALAHRLLDRALTLEATAPPSTRSLIRLVLGYIEQERDLVAARQRFTQAITLDPANAEAYVARAELALRQADHDGAESDALGGLARKPIEAVAARARATLRALDVLPASGARATIAIGGGWDSNAWQSGAAAASELVTAVETDSSPFGSASVQLEYVTRPGRRSAFSPYYSADVLIPTKRAVQALSLQVHELGAQLQLVPTRHVRLRLSAGSGLVLSGMHPVVPFSVEAALGARLAVEQSARSTLYAGLTARPVLGLGDRDYLSGVRIDGVLEERLAFGIAHVSFEAGYRYNGIGTQTIPADASVFPVCGRGACGDLSYIVPLGYHGPLTGISADVELAERLLLGGGVKLEYRRYLAQNAVLGIAHSQTLRHDLRNRVRVRAEWGIDAARHYALIANYDVLVSDSNMAQGHADARHQFDYANRNFVQHVVETRVEARF